MCFLGVGAFSGDMRSIRIPWGLDAVKIRILTMSIGRANRAFCMEGLGRATHFHTT
jgi:hypothetical protein